MPPYDVVFQHPRHNRQYFSSLRVTAALDANNIAPDTASGPPSDSDESAGVSDGVVSSVLSMLSMPNMLAVQRLWFSNLFALAILQTLL